MDEPPPSVWPAAPVDGAIVVEVEYAPDEFGRMAVGIWVRSSLQWLIAAAVIAPVVAFFSWDKIAAGEWWWWLAGPLAVGFVWVINLWSVYRTAVRTQRETATVSSPLTFIFGPERFWVSGQGFREELQYAALFGTEETREHILLMLNSVYRYVVPKRAIPNPQALATLRQTINQGLPGKAKRRLKA